MPVTEKTYPEWVQVHRKKGTTVKKKGDAYYLYKRTSKRVPGKKYPQPIDKYIGLITPDGVIESHKRKISLTDIEVWEYGYSKAVFDLCPSDWKKPLGSDWENVLKIIINKWSPTTYLNKDGGIMKEEDFHYQFPAQMASLNRRFFRKYGMELKELDILKTIYLVVTEKTEVISKIREEQRSVLERFSLELEV